MNILCITCKKIINYILYDLAKTNTMIKLGSCISKTYFNFYFDIRKLLFVNERDLIHFIN